MEEVVKVERGAVVMGAGEVAGEGCPPMLPGRPDPMLLLLTQGCQFRRTSWGWGHGDGDILKRRLFIGDVFHCGKFSPRETFHRRSFSQGAHFWVGEGGTLVFGDISYISHGLNSFWEYNESIKTNITFRGCTRGYNIPKFSHQDR